MKSLVLAAIVVIIATATMAAQDEVALPFDLAGRIPTISRELNAKMKLFPDDGSFRDAALFRSPDSSVVLEITRADGARLVRTRKSITPAEYLDLQQRVEQWLALNDDSPPVVSPNLSSSRVTFDQSGRSALLWGSTLWSLLYYGTATSAAVGLFDSDNGSAAAATYLIAGGMGYIVPALLTENTNVTAGAATLALGGMFQGAIHGWLLAATVGGQDVSPRLGFGLSVLTGVTETVVGYAVGTNSGISEGAAEVVNTTEFYSMIGVGMVGLAVIGDGVDSDAGLRVASGLGLLGAAGGVVLGHALSQNQRITGTDASVYATAGLLGLTLPVSLLTAITPTETWDGRLTAGLTAAGVAGGLLVGQALVHGLDFPEYSSTGIVLGTLAGGLVGLGLGVLAQDATVTPILAWSGAALGFTMSVLGANPIAELRSRGSLDFNFNPLGLALASRSTVPVPVGSLTYRF